MRSLTRRFLVVLALPVLALVALAAEATAATFTHKTTGEVIQGTLTEQKINKLRVFKLEDGDTRLIDPKEWTAVEDAKPATPEKAAPEKAAPEKAAPEKAAPEKAAPAEAKPAAKAAPAAPSEDRVYILPITGPIMHPALVEGIEKALGEARTRKCTFVVLRMDTPGGRIDVADRIIRLIEGVDWAQTVAWVEGPEKHALSAGAYICLATHRICMAPGTTIGAATPYRRSSTGDVDVDEKITSAFRARFRSLAQQRGHPAAIADAMVDRSTSVVQVWLDDKQLLVSEEEARGLEAKHKADTAFRRGKTIATPGKLVTLTSQEAQEYAVARGIAATKEELLDLLGCGGCPVQEARWLPDWVKQTAEKRDQTVEKWLSLFRQQFEQADTSDPHAHRYYVTDAQDTFEDGGRSWRENTDVCLAHLKTCAQALKELEKLAKDDHYDFPVTEEALSTMKREMQEMYARLQRERNVKRCP